SDQRSSHAVAHSARVCVGAARPRAISYGGIDVIREVLATTPCRVGFTGTTVLDDSPEAQERTRLAVARAKEGDPEGVRYLYATYSPNIYGYVRSIVRDNHEAEDVRQHVFA